jgi:hypothetical protein
MQADKVKVRVFKDGDPELNSDDDIERLESRTFSLKEHIEETIDHWLKKNGTEFVPWAIAEACGAAAGAYFDRMKDDEARQAASSMLESFHDSREREQEFVYDEDGEDDTGVDNG